MFVSLIANQITFRFFWRKFQIIKLNKRIRVNGVSWLSIYIYIFLFVHIIFIYFYYIYIYYIYLFIYLSEIYYTHMRLICFVYDQITRKNYNELVYTYQCIDSNINRTINVFFICLLLNYIINIIK